MWCRRRYQVQKAETDSDDEEDEEEDSDEADGEGGAEGDRKLAYVRIIGQHVVLDDDDATIVLIFPRGKPCGCVDPDGEVKNPHDKAEKIFRQWRHGNACFGDMFPRGEGVKVTQRRFQGYIRRTVVSLLLRMGLELKSFESIDGDETYLCVKLERDSPVLRHLARSFRYRLPFNHKAYDAMSKDFAGHPRSKPPRNMYGEEVFAYHAYTNEFHDKFQPFRDVDIIRLLMRILSQHMNLWELQEQGVISRYFIAGKHAMVRELHEHWVLARKWFWQYSGHEENYVRDYFGEEIAFFFQYYAFYIKQLGILSIILLTMWGVETMEQSLFLRSCLTVLYGVCLVVWATIVQDSFEHKVVRSRQKWGMDVAGSAVEPTLPTYRPELEGTQRLVFMKFFSHGCVLGACLLFSFLWGVVSVKGRGTWEAVGTTILIRVFSICWSMIVPKLVRLHNHRTQRRYNKSMVAKLGLVKLFLYLSPFLRTAFLVNWSQMTCASTPLEAAEKAFADGWPTGVDKARWEEWLPEYTVPLNRKMHRKILGVTADAKVCIWGCRPATCVKDRSRGTAGCRTNCYYTLQQSLNYLYFSHVGFSLLFVLIALVNAWCKARIEIKNATHKSQPYTHLQFQAKCDEVAKYEYASWGGSYVEDFLEVILSFAMVACFGIMQPGLALLAFIAAIAECRLVAYRMTHVTGRPYPVTASGIEMWQRLISIIVVLSVLVNAGLAVFLLPPFDRWDRKWKLLMFFGYGYMMLGGRFVVQSMFRRRPADVARIEDFNAEFLAKVYRDNVDVPAPQKPADVDADARKFDVGLERPGEETVDSPMSQKGDWGGRNWSFMGDS